MAILSSNNVSIYWAELTTSKPKFYTVADNETNTSTEVLADFGATGTAGDYWIIQPDGDYIGIGTYTPESSSGAGDQTFVYYSTSLLGNATSISLDVSNSIADVARDAAQGGLIQEATFEWSVQADGLLTDSLTADGREFVNAARDNNYIYVLVGEEVNADYWQGIALIDNITWSGTVDETATYSVSLAGVDNLFTYG